MDNPRDADSRSNQAIILAVSWTLTSIAIITVAGRLYTRTQRKQLGSDDGFMVAALTFQIAYQSILHVAVEQGLGKTVDDSTVEELVNVRKWALISSAFTSVVSILARISISILLIRTFGTRLWFKLFLIVSCMLMASLGILTPILSWTRVHPVEALWDYRMKASLRFDPSISGRLSLSMQSKYKKLSLPTVNAQEPGLMLINHSSLHVI